MSIGYAIIDNKKYFYKGEANMDITAITQLIGTLGFPIFCSIILFIRLEKEEENHKEEMNKITESLNNNTMALIKLSEKLES